MGCLVTWVTLVRWSLNFLPESITFLGVCVWGGGKGGWGGVGAGEGREGEEMWGWIQKIGTFTSSFT